MNSITITYIHLYHLITRRSCLVAHHVPQLLSMVRLLRRSILSHPRTHLHQVAALLPASSRPRLDRSHLHEEPSLLTSTDLNLLLIAMDRLHPVPLQASAAQGAASTLLCLVARWSTCSGFEVEAGQRHLG